MKTTLLLAVVSLALAASALADDQLLNVQTELKNQGFYYGDVNGQASPETNMAIRRYQIRNGLEVTGALNQETLAALGMARQSKEASAPPEIVVEPKPKPPQKHKAEPPVNLRRDESVEDSDRAFLRREELRNQDRQSDSPAPTQREPTVVPPPAPLEAPSADFPVLFAGTPYANAPVTVQQDTLRRAQSVLADRGFYRDIIDGLPGPATEEALLTYQRSARLTLTGRLDLDTLSQLRLLPGNSGVQFGIEFHTPQHVYRGIWVERR